VVGAVGHQTRATTHNIAYLAAKRDRMGHRLEIPPPEQRTA